MNQAIGQLVGTSNERLAKFIGKTITLWQITKGDRHYQITHERSGRSTVLVITYGLDVYEVKKA